MWLVGYKNGEKNKNFENPKIFENNHIFRHFVYIFWLVLRHHNHFFNINQNIFIFNFYLFSTFRKIALSRNEHKIENVDFR